MKKLWKNPVIWLVFACFCMCAVPSESEGYAYLSRSRWSFNKMPIPWYMTLSKSSSWRGRSKQEIEKLARMAFDTWENIDCSFMQFRYMGVTTTGSIRGDGLNTIEWVAELPKGASARAIGLGGPLSRGGTIYEGNVWIKAMERPENFIATVITHEIGHAIALGHTDVRGSIMYPSSAPNTKLSEDDKKGLCNAYPASANTCSDDDNCPTGMICKEQVCRKCKSDADCGGDKYCDKALCVAKCKSEADCDPKGRLCVNDRCTGCAKDEDCGATRFCKDALCQDKCKTDDNCKASETCHSNGQCIRRGGCTKNEECNEGEFCKDNKCISSGQLGNICYGAGACDDSQDCVPHDCKNDLDCNEGFTCVTEDGRGTCQNPNKEAATICALVCKGKGAIACPEGFTCKPFTSDKSYCYPVPRKPKPVTPPGQKPPGDNKGGGCGCVAGPDSSPDLGALLILLFGGFLLMRRKVRMG